MMAQALVDSADAVGELASGQARIKCFDGVEGFVLPQSAVMETAKDLLIQLVERDLPALIEEIVESVPAELPPDVRMRELTARMVEFVGTDHIGLILHTEVPRLSVDAQAAIAKSHRGLGAEFMAIYRSGVDSGEFREIPPALAARLIESTIMTGGRVVMDFDDPKQHVHDTAGSTADFLVGALRR